jgi:hypothetical protein
VLRHGDVVHFGSVEARYEEPDGTAAETSISLIPPNPRDGPPLREDPPVQFIVDQQKADVISNVGRDQHNQYNQYLQQRESFLATIAATKTRASRLVIIGFLMVAGGGGVYAWVILRTIGNVSTAGANFNFDTAHFFGPQVHGIPVGLAGFGVAFVGQFVVIAGIVLHIVAAARRRRLNNEMPAAVSPRARW